MSALEHLIPGDWEIVRRNFERIGTAIGLVSKYSDGFGFTVAGISVRFGVTSVTFTASPYSATPTVTHGLGKTPAAVLLGPVNCDIGFGATSPGATTFTLQGHYNLNTNLTGAFSCYWLAVG